MPSLTYGVRFAVPNTPLGVRLVVREQQLRRAVAIEVAPAVLVLVEDDGTDVRRLVAARGGGLGGAGPPRPLVAEPDRRQHVDVGGVRSAVVDRDADQDVFDRGLGVFDEHVEVAIAVEDAGVEELELRRVAAARARSPPPGARRGTPPADTCRATSCTSGSACCRGRSSTP